jgi:hypothetical protein
MTLADSYHQEAEGKLKQERPTASPEQPGFLKLKARGNVAV